MEWNRKQIRRNAWNTVFKRGFRAWLSLVAVCMLFAMLGVSGASQVSFLDGLDELKGTEAVVLPSNVEVLEQYIVGSEFVKKIPLISDEMAVTFVDSISKSNTWLIHLLGANFAYFKRNSSAIIVALAISAVITFVFHFFIQSAAVVGKDRYALECHFAKKVSATRIAAPFHRNHIFSLMGTMFLCKIVVALWSLTIVGGIYKLYQYRFVPCILAENPSLKWKQVKKLSTEMTKGYKWKMFVTDLTCIPVELFKLLPLCGICITVPFEAEYITELYLTLRKRLTGKEDLLIERAFDGETYVERYGKKAAERNAEEISSTDAKMTQSLAGTENREEYRPQYVLKSVAIDVPEELMEKSEYTLMEYLYMFFLFAFGGWMWEVTLYIVRDHMLVNRGTMYGPWLPIYGVGGVVIIFLLDRFKANKVKFFGLAIVICGILEFAASWILEFFFNSQYWDYKDMLINVNGRICLVGLLLFGFGGMAGVYIVAPKLSAFLRSKNKKLETILCVVLCIAFVIDLICCALYGFNAGAGVGAQY